MAWQWKIISYFIFFLFPIYEKVSLQLHGFFGYYFLAWKVQQFIVKNKFMFPKSSCRLDLKLMPFVCGEDLHLTPQLMP